MTITAHPLSWPDSRPRTERWVRDRAKFRTSFTAAREDLVNELRLLGAKNVVISSNVPVRMDGLPYARYPEPDDPGVAVYFDLDGQPRCFAIDKWSTVKDNMKSIQKTIEAIRGIERWGSAEMMHAAFEGFQALPAHTASASAWWDVLGVTPDATAVMIERAFRYLARTRHPDAGGTAEAFHEIQDARDRGITQIQRRARGLTA